MPLRNILVIAITTIFSLTCYLVTAKNRHATRFAEALEIVDSHALLPVNEQDLFDSAMRGMMKSLDEYSGYMSGRELLAFEEDMQQEFAGVGMELAVIPSTQQLICLVPHPDSPALEAGLRPGDRIMSVDGQSMAGFARSDAVEKIRGPVGSMVTIDVQRGDRELSFSIKRQAIQIKSTLGDWMQESKWQYTLETDRTVGYIRLTQFGDKSAQEMKNALQSINGQVSTLILDLRNNSGGLLPAAVDICDFFLPAGLPIVETRGRNNRLIERHTSTDRLEIPVNVPMAILVNRHSASASEIVAGCLQDHSRATIFGERTWGKGTVQNILPLQSNRSKIRLTTGNYFRPSGLNIDRNVALALDPETDAWGVIPAAEHRFEHSEDSIFEQFVRRRFRDLQWLTIPFNRDDGECISNETMGELFGVTVDSTARDIVLDAAVQYLKAGQMRTVSW